MDVSWFNYSPIEGNLVYLQFVAIKIRLLLIFTCVCMDVSCHFSGENVHECNCWVLGSFMVSYLWKFHTISRVAIPFYIVTGNV